LQKLVVVVKW